MNIHRAYKTELDPNNAQTWALFQHARAARFAWNYGLAERKRQYKETGKSDTAFTQQKAFVQFKHQPGMEWTYQVCHSIYQSAFQDLDRAYENFFAKRARFPRFKSRKQGIGSFRLCGRIYVENWRLRLPVIGWVRLKERGYLPTADARILNVTVSERAGRWYASLQVEQEIADPAPGTGPAVGVDLGLKTLAVASDGRTWENPKAFRQAERKLAKLQRRLARQVGSHPFERSSNRRERTKRQIQKVHARIANVRSHALHQLTSDLVARTKPPEERPAVIVLEDLNVAGMVKNRRLAKSISDAAFGEVRRQVEYKVRWYGGEVLIADRFEPSSKRCSECGAVKPVLLLSERAYVCTECGVIKDRDLNAALNLSFLAGETPESLNAHGGNARPADGQLPVKCEVVTLAIV